MGITDLDRLIAPLIETHEVNKLYDLITSCGVDVKLVRLIEAYGMASKESIYINSGRLSELLNRKLYFIILHELAHFKRINKFGWDYDVMFKSQSEEEFVKFMLHEEIFADRYARLIYFIFNKEQFPINETQQLHLNYANEFYSRRLKVMYAYLKDNPELTSSELLKQYIIND